MLHRLSPPIAQIENDLLALIDRQRQLLAYANTHSTYNQAILRSVLGDPFTNWITHWRRTKLLEALKMLIVCSEADKNKVLDDFDKDQEFWERLDDSGFQFTFSPNKTVAHQHAKICLNEFYEEISSSAQLLPTPHQFRREDIVNGYLITNSFLKLLCPCCDGGWAEQEGSDSSPYTLEHFFHKDEHPTICLHPYNLIPMCGVCNSRRRGKEVLESKAGQYIGINKIFHPLYRPAKELVELQYYSRDMSPERLQFVNLPTQLEDWREAIEGYDFVYEIPKRWQERWEDIDGIIGMQVRAAIEAQRYLRQQPISLIDFEQIVSGIISALKEPTGRYQYPARRWLVWAKQYRLEFLYEAHVEARSLNVTE